MRQRWMKGLVALAVWLVAAQAGFTEEVAPVPPSDTVRAGGMPVIKTQKDRESYSLGVETVRSYKRLGMDIDIDLVIRGMKDAAAGGKLQMTDADLVSTMINYRAEMLAKQRAEKTIAWMDNKKEEEEFLAANKTREGVITLPSGLQYKILKAGDGKKPTEDDTVECNWRGTLINGTEFENTYQSGQPVIFKVNDFRIIKGLRDALKLMPVGSKWQLFVPHTLAYGQRGAGAIGPNTTLIYEVELIAIK